MKTINKNIDRRSFFKKTTFAGSGLVLGFNWFAFAGLTKISTNNLSESEWHQLNAFLKISADGLVTIMAPNPEIGQNVKTSMPMIVAEELNVDWAMVRVKQAPLSNDFDRQVAGGSQSIRKGWDSLRKAGATAKQMLVNAAAQQWKINAEDCIATKGIVSNGKGVELTYGKLAAIAATLEVPENVKLKDPSEFTIIGKDTGNVDIQDIVTGKPLFGLDTKRDGMLYATALRPPAFGQTLQSFDDVEAKAINGVKDVLQFGDKIAIVATSTWAAIKGKRVLKAVWNKAENAESTNSQNEAMNALFEATPKETARKDGDVEQAFKEADEVVERLYEAPFLPHNCLEPMNFFADVKGDIAELYGPIQTPKWTQERVAEKLSVPLENVTIGMSRMGGGFGRRLYGDFALEAAEISQLVKAPIQLTFTREDDMTAGTYRPASKYAIKAAIKNNKITGYHLKEVAINSNMFGLVAHFFPAGAIDNYQVDLHILESNITTGAWRAPYTNFLASAEQSFFDELAEKLNIDAVQLRLDLLEKAKPVAASDEKIEYSPERMQKVIGLVAEKANWGKTEDGIFEGFSAYYSHNTHVAEVAHLKMVDNIPVVHKVFCAVDCGIVVNPIAAENQVKGGVIDGVGHAMYGDLTFVDGKPSNNNFHQFRLIRNMEAPKVAVFFVKNNLSPTGLGEPSLPPAGGAVVNAIYKATNKRLYKQPFIKQLKDLG